MCEQGCELDCRAKAARQASPFFVAYPARSQRLIPSDPFIRGGTMLRRADSLLVCRDSADEIPEAFPGLLPRSCRMVLPSSLSAPDSRAI